MPPLTIDGRTLIPTRWKATTKGDDAASPVYWSSSGSSDGTTRPTTTAVKQ